MEPEEVQRILRGLKVNKSKGPDGLSNRLLKLVANASLENGVVLDEWKAANVSPRFKSGDKTSVNHYRPISILPVVAKVFEKLGISNYMCSWVSAIICVAPEA